MSKPASEWCQLWGFPSPTGRRADGGQYRSDGKDGDLHHPPPSHLAHGSQGAGLSVTSTQGRVAGTPLMTLHWLSGARQRSVVGISPCRHPGSKAHGACGGPDRVDRRDCLTTWETRCESLRQAQRMAEGDNPVSVRQLFS
ncbi:hypothetical protein ACOMHN_026944 [Nucella lapillus]